MKKIITPKFTAKNNETYFFKLKIDNDPRDDSEYYIVELYDKDENKIGGLTLANVTPEKFSNLYGGKYGNIKFIEERQITDTGLTVEDGVLKINNKEYYKSFIEEELLLEDVKLKSNEREILTEIRDFIKTEKQFVKEKFNKPEIVSVYIPDGSTETQPENSQKTLDLRGQGIGKKLYEYASQWMGANNLKVYTQDLRTKDAINIWKSFKKSSEFNYGKDETGEYIYRKDGIELNNEVEELLKKKQESLKNSNQSRRRNFS